MHKNDRYICNRLIDLILPLADVVVRDHVIDGDAKHEDIGLLVLGLAIDTKMVIATRIVDLNLHLTAFDVLRAPVHIQYGRLVLIRELIMEVVMNQARFTYGCVSNENHFDLPWFT